MTADLRTLKEKRAVLVSGLFDAAYYRAVHPDQRASPADPLTHYLLQGEAEGCRPNPVFVPDYYRRHAMGTAAVERNALAHYAEEGERLGYKPHPAFDPSAYLAANPALADFVDRPLFHYLKIGRNAGLPVAPGHRGSALARVLEAQRHADDFIGSERRDHHALMAYRQTLVRELGVDDGFHFCREVLGWPDRGRVVPKPIATVRQTARSCAAFCEISPAAEGIAALPLRAFDASADPGVSGAPDALFVACLVDARVRARSGLIEIDDVVLVQDQFGEGARWRDRLELDPAVFHAADGTVWLPGSEAGTSAIELEEGFMLLGPESDDFELWMLDLLPRYLAANASGALPPVPVLIDQDLPARQRQSLQLMLPAGIGIVPVPAATTVRVRRLWCAASPAHMPSPASPHPQAATRSATAPGIAVVRELVRCTEAATLVPTGQDRVYLARRRSARTPINAAELEAAAAMRDFVVVELADLAFSEQVRLLRHADFVIAQEPSDLVLAWFARPGTRLCCLSGPEGTELGWSASVLEEIGIEVTLLSCADAGEAEPGRFGFRIDPAGLRDLLTRWLGKKDVAWNGDLEAPEYYLRLSEQVPGWTRQEEALELLRASLSLPPNAVVVEIGSFMGSGTILLAGARKLRGSGRVHVVDPFDCSGDPVSVPIYHRILAEVGGETLRDRFEANIREAGLSDWVEVHQGSAAEIAARWCTPVDLIFFDGDQSRAGVREAYDSWSPFLKPGSIVAVHNSAPDNYRVGHDGSRCLVEEEIVAPRYTGIRLVGSTTFASKVAGSPC